MELREGYKNTEVGVIPNEWEVNPLFEIGEIATGSTPPTINKNNYGEDYFFVSPADLGKGKYIVDTEKKLSKLGFSISRKFPAFSILFTCIGSTIGKAGIAKIELTSNQQINAVFPNESYSTDFLFYYLNFISPKIKLGASEQAVPMINKTEFGKTFIAFPPKTEQTAIATALSDADALINSLEKLIAKKRNIKQGAMQQLLKPKEGWEHKSLGEIGLISGAGVDKLINEDEVPVRLVNYMDVFKRDFIYSKELNHWVTAPQHKAIKCAVKQGDVFFTPSSEMRYDIAVSAVAMEDIPNAVYSYHLVRLRLSDDWDLNFRTYIFKTRYFLGQAEQVCEGSGKRYVITLPKFRSLKVYYPKTKEEQNEIATILSDMDAEIQALETKLDKYRKIKLGMMQNLLTGKIRLV